MTQKRNLFKNTIIIGIGTICTKLISFIMLPFYTMWLIPSEYGNYDLIVSYLTLLVSVITLQLEQAVFRFSLKNKKKSKDYLLTALSITTINMIILDIVAVLILNKSIFKWSFILYFDTYSIFVVLSEYFRGVEKLKEYSFYNIISSLLIVFFSVIMVPIFKFGAKGLMLAYGFSYVVTDIIIISKLKLFDYSKEYTFEKKEFKGMMKYSLPMIPNGISWWITNVSDRTLIQYFIGSYYNGIYAVACKIPTIVSLIFSIFNLSWQQTAINSLNDKDKSEYYKKIFKKLIIFLFTISWMIIAILPFAFNYILDRQYAEAIKYVPILILGAIYLSLGQFLGGILLAYNNTKAIGITTIIAAIINLIINTLFLKKYGLIIACISTMISYIIFYLRRYSLVKEIHDKKNIILLSIFTSIYFIISIFFIYEKNLILVILGNIIIWLLCIFLNKELVLLCISRLFKKLTYLEKK